MPYVSHRWLGGMLTNYKTIRASIKRYRDLEAQQADAVSSLAEIQARAEKAHADAEAKYASTYSKYQAEQRRLAALVPRQLGAALLALRGPRPAAGALHRAGCRPRRRPPVARPTAPRWWPARRRRHRQSADAGAGGGRSSIGTAHRSPLRRRPSARADGRRWDRTEGYPRPGPGSPKAHPGFAAARHSRS